jgi:uncharacterized damage-inducible protein DinB
MAAMVSQQQQHFRMFAGYNAWANRRLFAAVAPLPEASYRADRGVFFRSLEGTLNHLLVTDRGWMQRFTGEGAAPDRLDAILHHDFADLRNAREVEDARIVGYLDGLDEAALAGTIAYRRVSTPEPQVQRLALALAHWFNHQTHHRGQAHAVLTGLGAAAPELDLLFYQRSVDPLPPPRDGAFPRAPAASADDAGHPAHVP